MSAPDLRTGERRADWERRAMERRHGSLADRRQRERRKQLQDCVRAIIDGTNLPD